MISITKIYEFEAAHWLPHYHGPCGHLHGHSYRLEVTVSGPICKTGEKQGMIMDFSDLKTIIKSLPLNYLCDSVKERKFDHSCLNDFYENPTAEIMVASIAADIKTILPKHISLSQVRLWETRNSYVTWRP